MQTLTFNFFKARQVVSWLVGKEAAAKDTGMDTAGYYSELPLHNLGSVFFMVTLLPVIHLTLTILTCIVKSNWCRGEEPKVCFHLSQNVNLKTYMNVLVGYQTVVVSSAFIYLWHSGKGTFIGKYTFTVK